MAKILIVEDDPRLELTYDMLFAKDGHTVVRAHDGEEGLQQAEAHNPDVILLDIMMPKLSGIEFLQQYNVAQDHPNTRVIVFSNMESSDLLKQALELGAYRYEVKSRFSPKQVAQLVNDAVVSRTTGDSNDAAPAADTSY